MDLPAIDILLSTCNGARFLDAQLESLLHQSHTDWRLLVRDDGSTDDTGNRLIAWARREPRMQLIEDGRGRLGACRSFLALLGHSRSPAFAFCDQDDVWLPAKLAGELTLLGEGQDSLPRAVCCDAQLVNEELAVIASSYARFQRLEVRRCFGWPRLLAQNVIAGCTLVGNSALRQRVISSLPEANSAAVMHDWWVTLIARALGSVEYIDEPLLRYRQHRLNVLGAKGGGPRRYLANLRRGESPLKAIRYLRQISAQAAALDRAIGADLSSDRRRPLQLLAAAAPPGRRVGMRKLARAWWAGVRMTSADQDAVLAAAGLFFGRFPQLGVPPG